MCKHGRLLLRQSQIQMLTPGVLLAVVILGKSYCTAEEPCCLLAAI